MPSQTRFGMKMTLPSTVQIKHDLRQMAQDDETEKDRVLCAEAEGLPVASTWQEIADHYRARIARDPVG